MREIPGNEAICYPPRSPLRKQSVVGPWFEEMMGGNPTAVGEGRPRRLLIIYNPIAGQRRGSHLAAVKAALEGLRVDVVMAATQARGDAERLAQEADPGLFDAVIAAGGDGTVGEVVNGLAGRELPLGIIPLGTANVLALELDLPRDPSALARLLAFGSPRPVFLGEAAGRRFTVMAGVGLDARVVAGVSLPLKRLVGRAAYWLEVAHQLVRLPPVIFHVTVDGVRFEAASAIVGKGHFYGGRFVACPGARLDRPSFEVFLSERRGRGPLLSNALALAGDRLSRQPGTRLVEGTTVTIEGPENEPVQADGDLLTRLPVTLTVVAEPLPVIAPPV